MGLGFVALSIYNLMEALLLTLALTIYLALSERFLEAFLIFWFVVTKPLPNFGMPNIISCAATLGLSIYAEFNGETLLAEILGGWCALIIIIAYAMRSEDGDFLELNRAICRGNARGGCECDEAIINDAELREHLFVCEDIKDNNGFNGDII